MSAVVGRARLDLSLPDVAAVAALGLALASTGPVLVLAVVLGIALGRRPSMLGPALALVAVAIRWETISLTDVVGAQAVLGPAVAVEPPASAIGCGLAALALVAAADRAATAVALGAAGALVACGPAIGDAGDVALRALATLVATAAALAVAHTRGDRPWTEWASPAFGLAAVLFCLGPHFR